MEVQLPPKLFCNFLQKGLAKNNLEVVSEGLEEKVEIKTDKNGDTIIAFKLDDLMAGEGKSVSYFTVPKEGYDLGVIAYSESAETVLYVEPINKIKEVKNDRVNNRRVKVTYNSGKLEEEILPFGILKKENGQYVLYPFLESNAENIDHWSEEKMKEELENYHTRDKYENSELWNIANKNTHNLQDAIDYISKNHPNGTVSIPEGKFYFAPQAAIERADPVKPEKTKAEPEEIEKKTKEMAYVIKCADKVKIQGAGMHKTTLLPIADYLTYNQQIGDNTTSSGFLQANTNGLDMFYYNEYADTGFREATFLKDAQFEGFTVDGSYTRQKAYGSAGKGFMINLFENCTWDHVKVMNTDGSGFGIDCPKGDSKIEYCIAESCGKASAHIGPGGSGFGIGTGYDNEESLTISHCEAYGNGKFGFFFEHQVRFQWEKSQMEDEKIPDSDKRRSDSSSILSEYLYYKADNLMKGQYKVEDCYAGSNLYNFGGLMAYNVDYKDCVSLMDYDPVEYYNDYISILEKEKKLYTAKGETDNINKIDKQINNINSIAKNEDGSNQLTREQLLQHLLDNNPNKEGEIQIVPKDYDPNSDAPLTTIFFGNNDLNKDGKHDPKDDKYDLRSQNCTFSGIEYFQNHTYEINCSTGSNNKIHTKETGLKMDGYLWPDQKELDKGTGRTEIADHK